MELKIYRIGDKFGFYFSKKDMDNLGISKGETILLEIIKNNKKSKFITKFNKIVAIKKDIQRLIELEYSERVEVRIEKVSLLKKPKSLFSKEGIDLFYLINKIYSSEDIVVISEIKNHKEHLRIWKCHERGSCRQIILKRFVDVEKFGRLLGQLQAEGTKEFRFRLEFVNKSISEIKDYLENLYSLSIDRKDIQAGIIAHPSVLNKINWSEFEKETKLKIRQVSKSVLSKKGYGYRIYIGRTLLAEIILGSMDYLRQKLVKELWNKDLKVLAEGFFAKLLDGDGSLEMITKNRVTPQIRIHITDRNKEYLKAYSEIMKKLEFNPKIDEKNIYVRSYANLDNLKLLLRIRAFENTQKQEKLKQAIDAKLQLAKTQRGYKSN